MVAGRSLGRQFGWLWAAYTVSMFGTWLGFGAFPLIAILVLHAGPFEVSLLSAVGLAVGAVVAVPLGPWVEFRRKRPVMVTMDLIRFAALMSVPAAYALGWLTFTQLVVVSVVAAAADIAFKAAGGAYLKGLVPRADLLVANGRFEATTWTATVVGPPLGNAAIGLFGPVATVAADAISYLLSAVGIRAIGGGEPRPARSDGPRLRAGDLLDGWRHVLTHPALRPLFFNTILVNGLIMATSPLLAVLMLDRLGFAPWQYGLAFGAPCVGGLIGSRLARRLVTRFGQHKVLRAAGALRVCWPIGLAFVGPGTAGLVLVIAVQLGLVTCMGVFNPVFATYRLDRTASGRVARTLSAWSVTSNATIAAMTALWGVLADVTGPRTAIAIAGLLILTTPLLLPRHDRAGRHEQELAPSHP
ncbi:MFS transporter [Micromonospora narathiwatensis]|uniref:Predicted arabinose efflux permease, MFS family n=1 Tax=Micromonospora narathiwatensis TaxID=299146 RepID=A0A1A8ZNA2_9ACTN|nr:MFS transporter [Micromonospora narathiwatensis]SBT45370.1 Predicted arabinose efflux permease, MFS family [Micromonospora narathiwatensis]